MTKELIDAIILELDYDQTTDYEIRTCVITLHLYNAFFISFLNNATSSHEKLYFHVSEDTRIYYLIG